MVSHKQTATHMGASLTLCNRSQEGMAAPSFVYDVVCTAHDGTSKWKERVYNLVTDAGKNDLLTKYFSGSAYSAAWYLILVGSGTIASSDTLASHSGWTEQAPYSGNRPAVSWGTASGGSLTAASAVSISITATATIAGAGLCSVSSGSGGVLYSASDFSAARSVASGDTLTVTPTVSVS